MSEVLAWHFVGDRLRDGRPVPDTGVLLKHEGDVILCRQGLHASLRPIDALAYAPGNTLCRVMLSGDIKYGKDKLAGSERTILERHDLEGVLWDMARWSALQVLHLWDAPHVVKKYLETGDLSLRSAARASARGASFSAARAAEWCAARDASWSASRAAEWASSRGASFSTAKDASLSAARALTWTTSIDAEWRAALEEASTKQNEHFMLLLSKKFRTLES